MHVPEVAEFFQAQQLVEDRKRETERTELRARSQERWEAQRETQRTEGADIASALVEVRERNAAAERARKATGKSRDGSGKFTKDDTDYAGISDDAFRAAVGRDFGVHW